MNDDIEALGHGAIGCKRWRWLPGMRTTSGLLCIGGRGLVDPRNVRLGRFDIDGAVPDLSDACTLGGLLALVRKAWRGHVFVEPPSKMNSRFRAFIMSDGAWQVIGNGPSEAMALIAALAAAPEPTP